LNIRVTLVKQGLIAATFDFMASIAHNGTSVRLRVVNNLAYIHEAVLRSKYYFNLY
jgi:hypothetical protein